ncbi:MAG: UTRA domain-containing protein, partial [Sphingomicrobium sp.]
EDIHNDEPIIRTLERLTSSKVVRAEQLIEPDVASKATAKLLGIALGTPLLRTQRIYFTDDGEPIEIATLRYHPERYRYQVELRTRPYAV